MEDNKDFDKDKQGVETQQMPNVPTEGEDDEKKGTIVLFGHEFDKKKAVMAGLGGLLAIALIGGGVWYAASQKSEPKEPTTMVLESKRRIERLAMVTLPDRMFHFLKWTALMLVLFILVHIVWQMFS